MCIADIKAALLKFNEGHQTSYRLKDIRVGGIFDCDLHDVFFDFSADAYWHLGVLGGLSYSALWYEFKKFRGQAWADKAMKWVAHGTFKNPLFLLDLPEGKIEGGRDGKIAVAVGLGWHQVPVAVVQAKRSMV